MYDEDAIEELSRVTDLIPYICECCIGCEVESGSCCRGFVLSPKRAKEYLSKPHWIPVTERLPKEWKPVLTYQPYKNDEDKPLIRVSWYIGAGIWRECEQANTLELPVTHWMPLPKPPKEE